MLINERTMYTKTIYAINVILISIFVTNVNGDFYEACNEKPNHAFISSNTSCNHYVYCANTESYEGECPDGDFFNELLQTCDPKDLVDCKLNNLPLTTPTPTTSVATSSLFSIINATNDITTKDSIISSTKTSLIQSTSILSVNTNVVSTTTTPLDLNAETIVVVSPVCPSRDNPKQMIFVPHSNLCSDYFICYHGEKLVMRCSSMLHFNVITGKCDYPENVRCQTDFTKPKEQCQPHIIDLFPHTTNCNYFYSCRKGYLLLQQCPFGYGWDFKKRVCTLLQHANCYNRKEQ